MRKLAAALATFTLVTAALISSAGPASAKSELSCPSGARR
jgi:hypothetical protein